MKKSFYLLSLLFIIFSCENSETSNESAALKLDSDFTKLTGSVLSFTEQGVEVTVSDSKLMSTFKNFVIQNDLDSEPLYHKIVSIDGKNYLRFYSKDNYVSTIDLIETNSETGKKIIELGSTVCTSEACASGGGCVPNGDYCTACIPPNTQPGSGITGECKRSTSN